MSHIDKAVLIADIREFNRFYTGVIGLLNRYYLNSGYSLTEVRTLFELYDTAECTANDIIRRLEIDPSYMSRMIANFRKAGLLEKSPSACDGRAKVIYLTEKGRDLVGGLIQASNREIGKLVADMDDDACREVRRAIKTLEKHFKVE